ncbi:hypothetical protein GCM10023189_37960 [Nibrella saemangeumensis]|uniref:Uncharacterized protein n=2 Tax=Nibrella saemangeumensis TaxID=1084526 RepID=A0ABP8N5Y6_9BACT
MSIFPNKDYLEKLFEEEPINDSNSLLKSYYKRIRDLRVLYKNALFSPIIAEDYLTDVTVKSYAKEFKQFTKLFPQEVQNKILLKIFNEFALSNLEIEEYLPFYEGKLIDFIYNRSNSKLSSFISKTDFSKAIDKFIWFLARLVREDFKIKGKQVVPSTYSSEFQDVIFKHSTKKLETVDLHIEKCLPVPQANTPIESILSFKDKYQEVLINLQKNIKEFSFSLANDLQEGGVAEILLDFELELLSNLKNINKFLKREDINIKPTSWKISLNMDRSPNLPAFEKIKNINGNFVFHSGGTKVRAVRLIKSEVSAIQLDTPKLGCQELAYTIIS